MFTIKKNLQIMIFFLLIFCLLFPITVIASQKEGATVSKKPEKLVFWHMYFDTDANKGLVIRDFAKNFESATGIKVELSQVVWTDHIKRMATVGVTQAKTPDVFVSGLTSAGLKAMVKGGYVLPLDKYLTPDMLKEYQPALLEQCRINGKLYALPQESQVIALIYNKNVFKQLGIKKPTTLQELDSAMDKMLNAGILPLPIVSGTGNFAAEWLFQVLVSRVATQKELDTITEGKAKFSDKCLVVEETMARWAKKGYFGPNVLSNEWDPEVGMMYRGKIGMMAMGGFWPAQTAVQFHVDDVPYGILPTPPLIKNSPKQVAGGLWWGVSVNARTEYPKWAVRLAQTMTGKAFSEAWLRRTLNLASGKVNKKLITFTPLKEYLNILDNYSTIWFDVPAAIESDYANIQTELVAGKITAKEAASKIDKLFESIH